MLLRLGGWLLVIFALSRSLPGSTSTRPGNGSTIEVDASGSFTITLADPAWTFGGLAGAALTNLSVTSGTDRLGDYREIAFDLAGGTARHAAIRGYSTRPAILFRIAYPDGAAAPTDFPVLSQYPRNFGHLNFFGMFSYASFFAFTPEGPWTFFDAAANTFIFSPIANFMTAANRFGAADEIRGGMADGIAALPGFEQRTVLVFGKGINRTIDTWGQVLTDYSGKQRPANDADPMLTRLGYWTDNGSTYYYRSEPSLSYSDTLLAVKTGFDQAGVPLGYIQLDSWFYPKGPNGDWGDYTGGIYSYTAAAPLFGANLHDFQSTLGVPLITHARWIDANSPYRQQYKMSGNVAIDPAYWDATATYLADSGVATYEQDWLADKASPDFNLTDAEAFLDNMAAALATRNLTMQYCMASPRHLLQGSRYGNLTTARVSGDRFSRAAWPDFVYNSRLASALGIFPFTDVFMSSEPDNLLVATLSAGPVGIGDPIGQISTDNLLRAVRRDGVIVKPDVPLVPIDSSYLDAGHPQPRPPLVAFTYSDFGALRTVYALAIDQGGTQVAGFTTAELGLTGTTYVYNTNTATGRLAGSVDLIGDQLIDGYAYYIVAPVGPSGIAVLGDQDQFVSMGKQRVAGYTDDGTVRLTVKFATGEGARTIRGYAPASPAAVATSGTVGEVTYDETRQMFSVTVSPGDDQTAAVELAVHRRGRRPARPSRPWLE